MTKRTTGRDKTPDHSGRHRLLQTAKAGIDWAVELASSHGARIELVHALLVPSRATDFVPSPPDFTEALQEAASGKLNELPSHPGEKGSRSIPISTRSPVPGDPGDRRRQGGRPDRRRHSRSHGYPTSAPGQHRGASRSARHLSSLDRPPRRRRSAPRHQDDSGPDRLLPGRRDEPTSPLAPAGPAARSQARSAPRLSSALRVHGLRHDPHVPRLLQGRGGRRRGTAE